ncbi:hypothetical protein [Actinoplanes sp. GCM10030250]|uniref:hypothetical protein n=1 Tax=Actinoplanes sp. GCM10030250 TaxID=3273376 RepID=UPI003605D8C5
MSTRPRHFGLVTAGLLLTLAACSGGDNPGAAGATGDTPAAGAASGAATGAAQPAGQGPAAVLNEAIAIDPKVRDVVKRLSEECLRGQGVTEIPPRKPEKSFGSPAVQFSPTEEEAKEVGYGYSETSGEDEEDEFTFSSPAAEQRYIKALSGDGGEELGGCTKEARVKVYGAVSGPRSPVTEIGESAQRAYGSDRDVKAKLKSWRDCLAKAGHPGLVDPEDALRYAQYFHYPVGSRPGGVVPEGGPWPRKTARQKEITFALADAGCADSTGLRDAQQKAWDKALGDAVDERSAQVFGYIDAMKAALERGQRELKG